MPRVELDNKKKKTEKTNFISRKVSYRSTRVNECEKSKFTNDVEVFLEKGQKYLYTWKIEEVIALPSNESTFRTSNNNKTMNDE